MTPDHGIGARLPRGDAPPRASTPPRRFAAITDVACDMLADLPPTRRAGALSTLHAILDRLGPRAATGGLISWGAVRRLSGYSPSQDWRHRTLLRERGIIEWSVPRDARPSVRMGANAKRFVRVPVAWPSNAAHRRHTGPAPRGTNDAGGEGHRPKPMPQDAGPSAPPNDAGARRPVSAFQQESEPEVEGPPIRDPRLAAVVAKGRAAAERGHPSGVDGSRKPPPL